MGARSRPTFTKRQKERNRLEKQQAKAERRKQRKLDKASAGETGGGPPIEPLEPEEFGEEPADEETPE